jgi:hypothetical protein
MFLLMMTTRSLTFMMKLMVEYFVRNTQQGHECTHSCCVCFGLVGTNVMVTLKVLLWIFLCNLLDVCSTSMQESYALEKEVKISNFFPKGLHGRGFLNSVFLGYSNFMGIDIIPFFTFDKSCK